MKRLSFVLMVAAVMVAGNAFAAPITWDAPVLITDTTGGSEVINSGSDLVEAYNTGSGPATTINGVPFAVDAAGIGFDADSLASLDGADMGIYNDLLDCHDYKGDGSGAVFSLAGLDAGTEYLLQIFIADKRTAASINERILFFGDNDGDTSNNYTSPYTVGEVYSIVGTFTADAATQDVLVDIQNIEGWGHLNGYQLRTVPEPATMLLLGLGGLSLIRRKR